MKRTGFDAIVITGRAPRGRSTLKVGETGAEVKPADSLWAIPRATPSTHPGRGGRGDRRDGDRPRGRAPSAIRLHGDLLKESRGLAAAAGSAAVLGASESRRWSSPGHARPSWQTRLLKALLEEKARAAQDGNQGALDVWNVILVKPSHAGGA